MANEPITLAEASRRALGQQKKFEAGLIYQVANQSSLANELTYITHGGMSYHWGVQSKGSPVGTRNFNGQTLRGTAETYPVSEPVKIIQGDFGVDPVMLDIIGNTLETEEIVMKARGFGAELERLIIKGGAVSSEFKGLQLKFPIGGGRQVIDPTVGGSPTDGGNALTIRSLHAALSLTYGATHWFVSRTIADWMSVSQYAQGVTGQVVRNANGIGRAMGTWGGLPVIILDEDNDGNAILPFTEVGPGGSTATCTSVYCVNLSAYGLCAHQARPPQVRRVGETTAVGTAEVVTRMDWPVGIAVKHPRSITRIAGVSNAAITLS